MLIIRRDAPPKKIPIWDYWDFQDKLAASVLSKSVQIPSIDSLFAHAVVRFDLTEDVVAEHLERFMIDLNWRLR